MSSSVATQQPSTPPRAAPPQRVQRSLFSRVLARPEIGALAAAVAIFAFFYAAAPAFRELHKKYPVENLQESMGEGMAVGRHAGMPEFKMSPQQVQDVIAYLKLLDGPGAKKVR